MDLEVVMFVHFECMSLVVDVNVVVLGHLNCISLVVNVDGVVVDYLVWIGYLIVVDVDNAFGLGFRRYLKFWFCCGVRVIYLDHFCYCESLALMLLHHVRSCDNLLLALLCASSLSLGTGCWRHGTHAFKAWTKEVSEPGSFKAKRELYGFLALFCCEIDIDKDGLIMVDHFD